MRQTEPVQQPALFKEETGLPPIPARPAGVFVQDADPFDADPFADPDSTLENKPPPGEPHRVLAPSLVLPPIPALDPFADPLVLVSTSHDGDGLSRLSAGSIYDESIARASMSSNNVGYALWALWARFRQPVGRRVVVRCLARFRSFVVAPDY
jgi:hypothetical protein